MGMWENAIAKGLVSGIESALYACPNEINEQDENGWMPLHHAVRLRQQLIAELLLRHGANPSQKRGNRFTTLYQLAPGVYRAYGCTPLHLCAATGEVSFVSLLLRFNAEINTADIEGYTPLHLAARYGRLEATNELLRASPDFRLKLGRNCFEGCEGDTALYLAAWNGHSDVVELLISHGDTHDAYTAALSGEISVLRGLVDQQPSLLSEQRNEWTLLHYAAKGGHVDVGKFLVSRGADLALCERTNPLEESPFFVAVRENKAAFIDWLIERGATVNATDSHGDSAICIAVMSDAFNAVESLLRHGANPNFENKKRKPLDLANEGMAGKANRLRIRDLLRANGATLSKTPKLAKIRNQELMRRAFKDLGPASALSTARPNPRQDETTERRIQSMPKRCTKCLTPLDENSAYCRRCGAKCNLSRSEVVLASQQRPNPTKSRWGGIPAVVVIAGLLVWWGLSSYDKVRSTHVAPLLDKNGKHMLNHEEQGKVHIEYHLERLHDYTYNRLFAQIHNDSEWQIVKIRLHIRVVDEQGNLAKNQTYELDGNVRPFADGFLES